MPRRASPAATRSCDGAATTLIDPLDGSRSSGSGGGGHALARATAAAAIENRAKTGIVGLTTLVIGIAMDEKKTAAAIPGSETLGALWQSALGSIDEIRDVIVKGSQVGK